MEFFRVLLVEGSDVDAAIAEDDLSREPLFEISRVGRLEEAVTELTNVHIDAVVLEIDLPDSSGVATLSELRRCAPHIPIVVLTSSPAEQCELASAREGADDYFLKGDISAGQLCRVVRFAIEKVAGSSLGKGVHPHAACPDRDSRIAAIAHTLNNLLTVVIGQTEIAIGKLLANSPVRGDLSEVLIAAERATKLTAELLGKRKALGRSR